jgi:hypothetical protein
MNKTAIELSNTLTSRQKVLIRNLINDCMDYSDLDYGDFAPLLEALQHPSVYASNVDLSFSHHVTNRWMDGKLG